MGRLGKAILLLVIVAGSAGFWWYRKPASPASRVEAPIPGGSASAPSAEPQAAAKAAIAPETLSPEDQHKLEVLDQILATKNDNDPRMDTELRELSPAAKSALEVKYHSLAPEARNERGTIAFLIGRELDSAADADFLHSVLNEPPCLGLKDCGAADRGDDHAMLGADTTLAYPQLVVLHSFKGYLEKRDRDPGLVRRVQDFLAEAKGSRNPLVSRAAAEAGN